MCIGVLKEGIRQGGTTSVLGSTFAMSVLSIFIEGEYREKQYNDIDFCTFGHLGTNSNKPGNNVFLKWSQIWERESGDRVPVGPKAFLIDQYLPVWVRCTAETCRKWRKLPPSIDLRHVKQDIVKCSNCTYPQDDVRCTFLCLSKY